MIKNAIISLIFLDFSRKIIYFTTAEIHETQTKDIFGYYCF
jgi:hypothetical protein